MLHSGSRGVGNCIGTYFIELAKKDMQRMFIHLPDKDLAFLVEGADNFNDYVEAVEWAQDLCANQSTNHDAQTLDAVAQTLGRPGLARSMNHQWREP